MWLVQRRQSRANIWIITDWADIDFLEKGEMNLIWGSSSLADLFCHFLGGVLKSFRIGNFGQRTLNFHGV